MLFLSESDVRRCLSMKDCLEANRTALSSIVPGHNGIVPSRIGLQYQDSPTDWTLFKPAAYSNENDDAMMGIKVVGIRDDNPRKGLPRVPATVMVLHPETGMVDAILSATYMTAARTAAGSALSAQLFCSTNTTDKTLVLFGAGLQAECHVDAMLCALSNSISNIVIVNRTRERADALAESIRQTYSDTTIQTQVVLLQDKTAVRQVLENADIVSCGTNTTVPLFDGKWLKPNCHVTGVGSFTKEMQEVDHETVRRSRLFIDTPEAMAVGDLKHLQETNHGKEHVLLGRVLLDPTLVQESAGTGGDDGTDITFFKSVGTAIQDVLTAQTVVETARKLGIGTEVDMS